MFDSLPYRNDAATIFRRLIRSLPTRRGVIGVATCDKGLPAMMMALASMHDLPCVLVPGGVTLLAEEGEDAGRVQSVGARFAHDQITLEAAAENLCRACATPGGGCQFLGTAATSQVVGEALGMSLPHSALAPSGHPIWLDMARRSARAVLALEARGLKMRDILTDAAVRNAMVVHAAFGGSTNLILHLPAVAHAAGLRTPHRRRLDRNQPPRAAPGGCAAQRSALVHHRAGLPGGRRPRSDAALAARRSARYRRPHRQRPDAGRHARLVGSLRARRAALRRLLQERDGIDPDDVIMDPARARARRPDFHGHLPARQSRAGRFGDQEHRHRPQRGRSRWRLPHDRPGARVSHRNRRHRRHQEPRRGPRAAPAISWC